MSFGLRPEVFNAVDMIMIVNKLNRMIDPEIIKFGYIKGVIACVPICVDDAVRSDFLVNNQ
jgi:hypothetical protein